MRSVIDDLSGLLLLLRVVEDFLFLRVVPGRTGFLFGLLADLLVLIDELHFALDEPLQLSALPGGQSVDVYFDFILGNVLSFTHYFAYYSQMFRRK